jgi:iron complex transport system permease protein
VWSVLWHDDGSSDAAIIHDLRIPRTLLAVPPSGSPAR